MALPYFWRTACWTLLEDRSNADLQELIVF
jgi:hypothetical protein